MSQLESSGRVMCFATYSSATAAAYSAGFWLLFPASALQWAALPSGSRYRGVRITLSDEGSGASVGARVWGMWAAMDRVQVPLLATKPSALQR